MLYSSFTLAAPEFPDSINKFYLFRYVMQVEFETSDFILYRNDEDSKSIALHLLYERLSIADWPDWNQVVANRNEFYNGTDWVEQKVINKFETENQALILTKTKWDFHESFAVEHWIKDKNRIYIITSSFPENGEAEATYITLKQNLTVSAKWNQLPGLFINNSWAACDSPEKSGGISLFEKQIRSLMDAAEKSIEVDCHPNQKNQNISTAAIAAEATKSCLKGMANSVTDLIKFSYEVVNGLFKFGANSQFRKNVLSGLGSLTYSIIRDPSGFISKVFGNIWNTIAGSFNKFINCSLQYKVKMICTTLSNLISGGSVIKVIKAKTIGEATTESISKSTIIDRNKNLKVNVERKMSTKESVSQVTASEVKEIREVLVDSHDIKYNVNPSSTTQSSRFYEKKKSEHEKARTEYGEAYLEYKKKIMMKKLDENFSGNGKKTIEPTPQEKKIIQKLKEAQDKIDNINMELIREVTKELDTKGIKYRVHGPKDSGENLYANLSKYIQTKNQLAKNEKELQELVELESLDEDILELMPEIKDQISDLKKQIGVGKTAVRELEGHSVFGKEISSVSNSMELEKMNERDFGNLVRFIDQFSNPHIEIISIPGSKVIESAKSKLNTRVYMSPENDLMNSSKIKGSFVSEGPISMTYLRAEDFINNPDIRKNSVLLHELRHAYLHKQRQLGKETPYNITFTSSQDFTGRPEISNYAGRFTFEEVSTFAKGSLQTGSINDAKSAAGLGYRSLNLIDAAENSLKGNAKIEVISKSKKSYDVQVPVKTDKESGSLTITLMGAVPKTDSELKHEVSAYLARSKFRIQSHVAESESNQSDMVLFKLLGDVLKNKKN